MIGFTLNEEQLHYQKMARSFAEREMKPYAAELDRRQDRSFDWEIVRRFAKSNLLALRVPQQYGGMGVDQLTVALIAEELGAACMAMTEVVCSTWMATCCLALVGNEDQRKRYLPSVCGDDAMLAGLAITEPEAGSDINNIRTLATRKGDRYILNGKKIFITNAGLAGFYIVFATTDPSKRDGGLNAFIVDGDSKGLRLGEIADTMGLRASQAGELIFDNVEVPVENLLGVENTGYLIAMQTLDMSRPCVGASAVGIARSAYEVALSYARKRVQHQHPIIENQAISFMLANMAIEIEAARLLTWKASWLIDQGMDSTMVSSMCKVFSSEMADRVCANAMQILGGAGYTSKWPVEKYLRDIKALLIYEGTNQIQRVVISSMLE